MTFSTSPSLHSPRELNLKNDHYHFHSIRAARGMSRASNAAKTRSARRRAPGDSSCTPRCVRARARRAVCRQSHVYYLGAGRPAGGGYGHDEMGAETRRERVAFARACSLCARRSGAGEALR